MRCLAVLLFCVAVASATTLRFDIPNSEHNDEWISYKKVYNKKYPSLVHETVRRIQWEKNLKYIQQHNLDADLGKYTYRLGINGHADLSNEEYKQMLLCRGGRNTTSKGASTFLPPSNVELPVTMDWRTKGYVTPVKNQAQCGSCWAFSATGSLEGQHFKKNGQLVSLSEQNLVDCSRGYGNLGCSGGLQDNAFQYIKANNGIDTEASYPYEARDGRCRFKRANVGATITGFTDIKSGSEESLQSAAATVGPISVGIDASHPTFQLYQSGVYYEPRCSTTQLDHGVLVVGYGTENGKDYWLVKNSWGASYGLQGYIKMSRNRNNNCGIATSASYPLV